jgi:predicted RNA polymerase sigma factor
LRSESPRIEDLLRELAPQVLGALVRRHLRLEAVRGHLLELAGDLTAARESYQSAARMTASIPEQRYLALRAARLG